MNHFEKINSKILDEESLNNWLEECRRSGKKIVFSNGCFDILHRGHVEYLSKAAAKGDVLIIGLNTDASVKRLKGPSRPVNDEKSRAFVLAALGFVSAVTLFDEDTPYQLINKVKENILLGIVIIFVVMALVIVIVKLCKKSSRLAKIWHGFVDGIRSVVTMKRKWRFIIYTLGVWGFYVVMTWLPFYMLGETSQLGFVEAVTLLGIATLGVVAPVPGGIGTYHFICITLLSGFYGIPQQTAGSFAALNHGSQMIFYIITGVVAYVVMMFFDKRKPSNE